MTEKVKRNNKELVCPICGSKINIARWAETIMEKESGKTKNVAYFVPYRRSDDTFDLEKIEKAYPENKYWIYSFDPDKFVKCKVRQHGAFCIKCNADL